MEPAEIEDQIIHYTNRKTGRTVVGRMNLYHREDEPDCWRIIYHVNPLGGLHLQEDVLLPFEVHKDVQYISGKFVLEWEDSKSDAV